MADQSDVSHTLMCFIGALLYPNGADAPSVTGVSTRVFVGWPQPAQLDGDLAAGYAEVSIYPRSEERNTTRFPLKWQRATVNTPTLSLSIAGQSVTVAGEVPPSTNPHNTMVRVNGNPYVYPVQVSDSLSSIAAALSLLIAADVPGTASVGPVITLPGSARLQAARVGVTGVAAKEIRRQEKVWQISTWASTPLQRSQITKAIDTTLAKTFFLTLPDLSAARLIYKSSVETDNFQNQRLFRRDLFYTIEYPTLYSEVETQITQGEIDVDVAIAGVPPFQTAAIVYY